MSVTPQSQLPAVWRAQAHRLEAGRIRYDAAATLRGCAEELEAALAQTADNILSMFQPKAPVTDIVLDSDLAMVDGTNGPFRVVGGRKETNGESYLLLEDGPAETWVETHRITPYREGQQ